MTIRAIGYSTASPAPSKKQSLQAAALAFLTAKELDLNRDGTEKNASKDVEAELAAAADSAASIRGNVPLALEGHAVK